LVDNGISAFTKFLACRLVSLDSHGRHKGFCLNGPLTYLLLITSFICSAMSKSAGGFIEEGADCGLTMDFRMANDLALEGDMFAFIFDGDRGISGDITLGPAIFKQRAALFGLYDKDVY
jgi:hypothetical protein